MRVLPGSTRTATFTFLVCSAMSLLACGVPVPPTVPATPAVQPEANPTATGLTLVTPTPTATPVPPNTPSPTPSNTPTPLPTPLPPTVDEIPADPLPPSPTQPPAQGTLTAEEMLAANEQFDREAEGTTFSYGPSTAGMTIEIAGVSVTLPPDVYLAHFIATALCPVEHPCPYLPYYVIQKGESTITISPATGYVYQETLAEGDTGVFDFLNEVRQ